MNSERAQRMIPPRMVSARVLMRPITPEDYPALYRMSVTEPVNSLWRFRGATPGFDEFVQTLFRGVLCQFAMTSPTDGKIIGQVTAYNADLRNDHCYASVCVGGEYLNSGLGIEGFGLFVNYLFYQWNFRKIFLEVAEMNYHNYESGLARGIFQIEGRLREYLFLAGQWWDQLILAVDRESLEKFNSLNIGR